MGSCVSKNKPPAVDEPQSLDEDATDIPELTIPDSEVENENGGEGEEQSNATSARSKESKSQKAESVKLSARSHKSKSSKGGDDLNSSSALAAKAQELLDSGEWQSMSDAQREGFLNKILVSNDFNTPQKKALLESLGYHEFRNILQETLNSDEPVDYKAETLVAAGVWEMSSPEEKNEFKNQILQDDKLTKEKKEELFARLNLPEGDLPTEDKEALKFEILRQEVPVEDRVEFLLEGKLFQYCLKPERERFKQEILLRGALTKDKKKDLFKRMSVPITEEELLFCVSRTTQSEDQKRQVTNRILNDDALSLERKSHLLTHFKILRLNKAEEDRLMFLILFDSKFLEVKRELLSKYRLALTPESKKRLKGFLLRSTEVTLEFKRSFIIDFKLGSLTPEEKETFRHQILNDSTLSTDDKRIYLIEFGIIKDTEGSISAPVLGDAEEEYDPRNVVPVVTTIAELRHEDVECKQRIKASLKLLKRDALKRKWDRHANRMMEKAAEEGKQEDEPVDNNDPNWTKWMGGHIQNEGSAGGRVLEVGAESIITKRVLISDNFYASEVGVKAQPRYRHAKTKHGTLCLIPEFLDQHDDDDPKKDAAKPLDYFLQLGFREIILHASKNTGAIINDRSRSYEDPYTKSTKNQKQKSAAQTEEILSAAISLIESDEERYILKSGGDRNNTLDYFTEYEYGTYLMPAVQEEPSILEFEFRADTIINLPVHTAHTYSCEGTPFARFVLQLVNPPKYSMFIINTIVQEMKLDIYRHETAETFRDVLSLVNGVAAIGVPNPDSDQLRKEVGNLLFHRLMYTTTPKLLGKIKPLHDLVHKEFVENVLVDGQTFTANSEIKEAELDEHLDSGVHTDSQYNSSVRKIFEKLLTSNRKATAVVSRSSFSEVLSLIRKTRHMATSVRVEASNLESVLQTVDELNEIVSLNFLFVRVVGSISITDLSRLVRHAEDGSVRMLLINSGNLVQQLQLGGNLDSVYIAENIGATSTLSAVPYDNSMPISKVINHMDITEDIFLKLDFAEEIRNIFASKDQDWRKQEESRLMAMVDEEDTGITKRKKDVEVPSHAYSVIRSYDVPYVATFYANFSRSDITISVQDAKRGQGMDYDQLKADKSALVVLNSDLLSTIEKNSMFEKCLLEGVYLVLVTTRVSIDDLVYQPQQFKGLQSFQPKLYDAQAGEDDILDHVNEILDRMDETWSQSDILYVVITFRVFRLVFGAKCSLSVLNETFVTAIRRRSKHDINFICQALLKQAEGMLDSSIFDLYAANVEDFVTTVCNFADPDEIYEYPAKRDHDEIIGIPDLAKLCQSYIVHCLRYEYDIDLPFDEFLHHTPVCQFISQRQRIRSWMVNVLGDVIFKETDMDVNHTYNVLHVPDGNNTHSNYLLAYWVPENWLKNNASIPKYLRVASAEFELEELIVQRSTEMEELSWESLRSKTFPKNLDFLMDLLSLYPYPLKILCSVAERKLFVNMLQTNNPRFKHSLNNLAKSLVNENVQQILSNGAKKEDGPMASLNNHLAIIRWCLFGCGAIKDVLGQEGLEGMEVTDEDIRRIIKMKLPFSAIATKKDKRIKHSEASGNEALAAASQAAAEESKGTLDNVLKKICTFDLDDFLFKEVTFQKHLINDASEYVLELESKVDNNNNPPGPLGSVVVNFVLHPIISKIQGGSPFMQNPLVKTVQLLVDGKFLPDFEIQESSSTINQQRNKFYEAAKGSMGPKWQVFLNGLSRFTPLAFTTLVVKAASAKQAYQQCWLLEHVISAKSEKEEYLRKVFANLAHATSSLQRYFFIELIFRSEKLKSTAIRIVKFKSEISTDEELNNALYCLSVSGEIVQSDAEFDPARIKGKVPLQHLPMLSTLFMGYFTDKPDMVIPHATRLLKMLHRDGFRPLMRAAVSKRAKGVADGRKFDNSILLLTAWAMHPTEALDSLDPQETKWLQDIVKIEAVDFYKQVKTNLGGVSPLALYFVLPCALSYSDLEHFTTMFKNAEVGRVAAIICQDGVMYPPYLLRYPKGVKLSDDVLDELDEAMKGWSVSWEQISSLFKSYTTSSLGSGEIHVAENSQVRVKWGSPSVSTAQEISVDDHEFPTEDAKANNFVLVDGGLLLQINSVTPPTITCTAKKSFTLQHGKKLVLPYMNEKYLCKYRMNITSGVSPETVKTNLEAMLTTTAFKPHLCTCHGNTLCVNCATCSIVQVVLWTWLMCIGATENRVRTKWLAGAITTISDTLKLDPDSYWRKLLPDKDKHFSGYSTNLPFPSVVNTRWIVPSSAVLFGNTDESKRKTVNYLRTLSSVELNVDPKNIVYDEVADQCSENLGEKTALTMEAPVQVNTTTHKKRGFEKKHVDLEPLINLLNPFTELLLQLLMYIPGNPNENQKSKDIAQTYLTYIERMLSAFVRGFKKRLPSGDSQKSLKEAMVYRSLFSLIGKPLKHPTKIHTILFRVYSAATLQKCGSSLKELRWLKWNKFVEGDFEVQDPLENENREYMMYPQTDKTNKLSLTEVKDYTSSTAQMMGLVSPPQGAPPVQAEAQNEETKQEETADENDPAWQHRGSIAAIPSTSAAPAESFEDLPPLQTIDDRVIGGFIDCTAILGIAWYDYCARLYVKPGALVSLVKMEEGALKFIPANEKVTNKYEIVNTFATNMYAWRFARAHEGVVLYTNGCVLMKTETYWNVHITNVTEPFDESYKPDNQPIWTKEEEKDKEKKEEKDGDKKKQAPSAAPDFGKFRTEKKKGAKGPAVPVLPDKSKAAKDGKKEIEYTEEMHIGAPRFDYTEKAITDDALFVPFWVIKSCMKQFKMSEKHMRVELLDKLTEAVFKTVGNATYLELKNMTLDEMGQRLLYVPEAVVLAKQVAAELGKVLKGNDGNAADQSDLKKKFEGEEPAKKLLHELVSEEAGYQVLLQAFRPLEVKQYMQKYFQGATPHTIFTKRFADTSLAMLQSVLASNTTHKKDSCHRDGIAPHEMVQSFIGKDCIDIFFLQIDEVRDRCQYLSDRGQNIGFFLPVSVLSYERERGLLEAGEQGSTKQWLIQFLVSGLPDVLKAHVLNKMRLGDSYIKSVYDYKVTDTNVIAMLYAMASCNPVRGMVDDILRDIRDVYGVEMFNPYCLRVGARNEYGIHVVSEESNVLRELQRRFELVVPVHLQDDQSVSNLAPLYSKVIQPFTKYGTCFVYVTGLQNVHDRLLKWVAEYTKSVPWAYVYFEGIDTTWNLPENTDRCFFHPEVLNNDARTKVICATQNANHGLTREIIFKALREHATVYQMNSEGTKIPVSQVHKVHEARSKKWVAFADPDAAKMLLDLETLDINGSTICMSSNLVTYTAKCFGMPEEFLETLRKAPQSLKLEERTRHWTDWIKKAEDVWDMDWKLIHGSPGIGKTYKFDEEIIPTLKTFSQVHTAIVDGSSDKLVKFSLLDVLSEVPSPAPDKADDSPQKKKSKKDKDKEGEAPVSRPPITLVVLDEYHMMPDAQKRQLIHWYARQARMTEKRMKLVMIANRIDINDRDLMESAIKLLETERYFIEKHIVDTASREAIEKVINSNEQEETGGTEEKAEIPSEVRDHIIEIQKRIKHVLDENILFCRRGWEAHCNANKHIKQVVKINGFGKDDTKDERAQKILFRYFKLWLVACRNLFGEDMMTFRLNDRLAEGFKMLEDKDKVTDGIATLAGILKKKMPSLPTKFCQEFVKHMSDVFKAERSATSSEQTVLFRDLDSKYMEDEALGTDALDVVIKAALVNINDQDAWPYPDFSMKKIPNSFLYHPAQKIFCWVYYQYCLAGQQLSQDRQTFIYHTLAKLKMRDLPSRFPQWFLDIPPADGPNWKPSETCEVICVPGDPRDLEWIVEKLKRGFSIDWDNAYSTYQRHNITNVRYFKDVVYQSEGIALHYVPSDNLVSLIEIDEDEIANGRVQGNNSLAESICKHMQPSGNPAEAPHNHPFNIACWMLYKRWFTDESKQEFFSDKITFSFFIWASLYAHKYMEHSDKAAFEESLSKTLIQLSEANIMSEQLDQLWSHSFAHLMTLGREHLSYNVAFRVTQKYYPPLGEWDDKIQALCQLMHGHCTPLKLDVLAADEFFWEQLQAYATSDKPLVEHVVEEMIKVSDKGDLTETTQVALLSKPLTLPSGLHHAYAYKFELGIKKLRGSGKEVAENWDKKEQPFYKELKQIESNLFLLEDE